MLACARDAFRNGHRDLARTLLEPYYALLQSDDVDEELQFRAVSIAAMRDNICSNLDYYGNPAGWLPRMRLSSNFDLFQTLRVLAARMLFYGQKGEQKYATPERSAGDRPPDVGDPRGRAQRSCGAAHAADRRTGDGAVGPGEGQRQRWRPSRPSSTSSSG